MKTIKTSELSGAALDWAVCVANGETREEWLSNPYTYSTNWLFGGPIIEREKLTIEFVPECYWHFPTPTDTWTAHHGGGAEWIGQTPLIAAMRCYVASRMGDTVEVPEELLK